jgi:hypothetical protein
MMINKLQAMMDGMGMEWQCERGKTQMTLGKLIDRLASLPPETMVDLTHPHSYRGYYMDLAFECATVKITATDALILCRSAMGEVFTGYKGGEYQMGRNTPVWQATYGSSGGKRIMGIREDGTLDLEDEPYDYL